MRNACVIIISLFVLCACSTSTAPSNVVVEDAWVRPAFGPEVAAPTDATVTAETGMGNAAMGEMGAMTAAYMTFRNTGGADALVGVRSDVATTNEIHQTTMEDNIMRMQEVESLPIPANGEVVFEPGGYHIMLVGLRHDLNPGDTVKLTFEFENGGSREVVATVREP
jgi:periplasmic copper chaperone A